MALVYAFSIATVLLTLLLTPCLMALYLPMARRLRERGVASG